MIEFLREWAMNVVIISIFITFVEILLPNSTMKRYVNMVVGLLLIIVIITPFINLVKGDFDFEKEVFSSMNKYGAHNLNEEEEIKDIQQRQIMGAYKRKLSNEVQELLQNEFNYHVEAVNLNVQEDGEKENFGRILSMEVKLSNVDKTTKQSEISVSTVKVGVFTEKFDPLDELNNQQSQQVKNLLMKEFDILEEDVRVFMREKDI